MSGEISFLSRVNNVLVHTNTHTEEVLQSSCRKGNLENDPWEAGGRSGGNFDEV